jgi:chromosome partitioning protein
LEKPPSISTCSVCGTTFQPRVSYQLERRADGSTGRAFCSLPCKAGATAKGVRCDVCGSTFSLTFAYQAQRGAAGSVHYVCSEGCRSARDATQRAAPTARAAPAPVRPYRVAVLNQKGGTGKTTTSISLAAGLAEAGCRVLLVDADPQGNVGVSLGVRSEHTLYHVLMDEVSVAEAVVPLGECFDVLTSDDNLAAAEIKLAQHPARGAVLKRRLEQAGGYTHVVIDCGPSLSIINQNALCYVDEVLVPVACDYLSLVGVKQVLKTIKNVNQHLGHPLRVGGVLPTFYDGRAKICRDAHEALQKHFGDVCLPPIRMNTKLKEAPSHKKTIFEHDAHSTGADDYRAVVKIMMERARHAVAGVVGVAGAASAGGAGESKAPERAPPRSTPAPVQLGEPPPVAGAPPLAPLGESLKAEPALAAAAARSRV